MYIVFFSGVCYCNQNLSDREERIDMTHDEIIDVVRANKEGKTTQFRSRGFGDKLEWHDNGFTANLFNFTLYDYRIKPVPISSSSQAPAVAEEKQ